MKRFPNGSLLALVIWSLLVFVVDAGKDGPSQDITESVLRVGRGLVAHYYKDGTYWNGHWVEDGKPTIDPRFATFTNYAYTRVEPLVNHVFVRRGWFSVRWQGTLDTSVGKRPDKEAEYQFHIWADDGCRLYIDGKLIIDSWRDAWEADEASHRRAKVTLSPGKHKIVLEYFQGQSLAKDDRDPMKLYWSCPARKIPEQIIPASHFSHTVEDFTPNPGRNDK